MVKHGQITPKMGQTKRTFERKACGTSMFVKYRRSIHPVHHCPEDDHVLFMHYARQLAENLRNVVFVDKVCSASRKATLTRSSLYRT